MPTLLSVETSTAACSVAVLCENGSVRERFTVAPQQHTQILLPMIDELLADVELTLTDMNAIVYSAGPGSFTGLRIGLGVVQGLAFASDLPLIKESSLRVAVAGICREHSCESGTIVIPAFDAHMGEVYWGVYRIDDSDIATLHEDSVGTLDEVLDTLRSSNHPALSQALKQANAVVGVGDGLKDPRSMSELQQKLTAAGVTVVHSEFLPHAQDLVRLGAVNFAKGNLETVFEAAPTYVRNHTTWTKRQRIRNNSDRNNAD